MDFSKILEVMAEIMFALKQAQSLPVGDSQDVDTPDVEISFKGHHYSIEGLTVRKIK